MNTDDETRAVAERYARRPVNDRYSPLQPDVWQTLQERQAVLIQLLARQGITDLSALRLVEVGCGTGGNLLELLRLGFQPQHLVGLELLPDRLAQARQVLPAAVQLRSGDATQAAIEAGSQDIVFVSTVFSSLLDDAFQEHLAQTMWAWLRPGGAVLWYDFTVNNPRNADVRGVPLARVKALFPATRATHRKVTLAPPLARAVCRVHPSLYTLCNSLPLLRTHLLAWLEKPRAG